MESKKLDSEKESRMVVANGGEQEEMGKYWSKGINFHLFDD